MWVEIPLKSTARKTLLSAPAKLPLSTLLIPQPWGSLLTDMLDRLVRFLCTDLRSSWPTTVTDSDTHEPGQLSLWLSQPRNAEGAWDPGGSPETSGEWLDEQGSKFRTNMEIWVPVPLLPQTALCQQASAHLSVFCFVLWGVSPSGMVLLSGFRLLAFLSPSPWKECTPRGSSSSPPAPTQQHFLQKVLKSEFLSLNSLF